MADHVAAERLQPSLLDRLTDQHPEKLSESRTERVISSRDLKELVVRDLEWLLNTVALSAVKDLADAPEASKSVLNYGVADLTGMTASGIDKAAVERSVRQAIIDFEPRIIRGSLTVNVFVDSTDMTGNALGLEIEGMIWGQPMPQRLYVKTEVDLENGAVHVSGSDSRI